MAVALTVLCGCAGKSASAQGEAEQPSGDSVIVVYYSQTGATRAVAEELQSQLGCAIAEIEAVNPYDGDYNATIQRWQQERAEGKKVEIKPLGVNLDNYSTVFLGFPIWGGTYALPVAAFLADNSLEGKSVVTFATFGSGGIDAATADVKAAQPQAEVVKGYGVRNARVAKAPAEITRFLIENGYVSGEITGLPEYSGTVPVTDEDVAVFDAACGNYQFPLGTPVSVAKRSHGDTTDYRYDVKSQTPDGRESSSTIYVTVAEGAAPEFTEVVRH